MKATGYKPQIFDKSSSAISCDYYETSAIKNNIADVLKYIDVISLE